MNIDQNVQDYRKDIGPFERYASFDYCFNYFQQFREEHRVQDIAKSENMQTSCLQLGFYLASWGMYRGSTLLLQKSVKYLEQLIAGIASYDPKIWDIDLETYDTVTIALLLDCQRMIKTKLHLHALSGKGEPSTTLTTKIMLGVFGNIPAFDAYFKEGFHVTTLNNRTLFQIAEFYKKHRELIDSYQFQTLDFMTGTSTKRTYTKAKIIDMIGFMEGYRTQTP